MKPEPSNARSPAKAPAERVVKDIRRQTGRHFSAEDKIRVVLEGLRGEDSIAELCRKEGIAQSLYYTWTKEFMEAGKRRLAGDTARAATTGEVQNLRREARALKECVADLTLENRLLKKRMARRTKKRCSPATETASPALASARRSSSSEMSLRASQMARMSPHAPQPAGIACRRPVAWGQGCRSHGAARTSGSL